jgi:Adenylate and Guanylate cyclase catalytic domain
MRFPSVEGKPAKRISVLMVFTSQLNTYLLFHSFLRSKYSGPPLNENYCQFTFVAYPSATMEAQYVTSNPIYFTVGALLIFCFTSSVFLLYDYTVERRQRKVMSTAVRTNAIVASLFPSVVRDRIYPTEQGGHDPKTFNLANSKARLKSFLSDGTSHADGTDVGSEPRPTNTTAPIAELFPEYVSWRTIANRNGSDNSRTLSLIPRPLCSHSCTVLFADVVGFTAWSSIRDPAQVFLLLETIYGAFDAIARKRGVFKVRTVLVRNDDEVLSPNMSLFLSANRLKPSVTVTSPYADCLSRGKITRWSCVGLLVIVARR